MTHYIVTEASSKRWLWRVATVLAVANLGSAQRNALDRELPLTCIQTTLSELLAHGQHILSELGHLTGMPSLIHFAELEGS